MAGRLVSGSVRTGISPAFADLFGSIDAGEVVVQTVSHWGIAADGTTAYFDDSTVDEGDDAVIVIDPTTGQFALTKVAAE